MDRRRDGRRALTLRAGGGGLLLTFLIGLAAIMAGPAPALPGVAAPPTSTTLSAGETRDFWTPERFAEAEPLELPQAREPAEAGVELFSAGATPFKSTIVNRPEKYPNRVHGKLFGVFPDVGLFSCSATVVSSRSRSLITSAGHCVFDKGRSNQFATNLLFVPGFGRNSAPYGSFPVTNAITTRQWVLNGSLDYDISMLRLKPNGPLGTTVQKVVGSRGIGFDQPRHQRLTAYGYPSGGRAGYDGYRLVRCDSGYVPDPARHGGQRSRGMRCDQQQGASGGGWVAQHSFVVSNVSHGHPGYSRNEFFGPYYGAVAKSLYKADQPGYPSIGPIGCRGKVVSIAGTNRNDKIRGTNGQDVIATLGGNDRILGGNERDLICGGTGTDRILGGGGDDRIDGGAGADRCDGARGKDRMRGCEVRRAGAEGWGPAPFVRCGFRREPSHDAVSSLTCAVDRKRFEGRIVRGRALSTHDGRR